MPLPERAMRISSQASAAFTAKAPLDSFWQEVAELHFPEHADFTIRKQDDKFASIMYDGSPALFRRDFGNYLGSVLRPKGRYWFKGRVLDDEVNEIRNVRAWLEDADDSIRNRLYDNKSQFIHAMSLADHQYVTFGNSVTSAEPRADRSGMLFRTWHLRDCAWFENTDGEVDTLFRRFKMRVSQLCGKEYSSGWKIPDKVKDRKGKEPNALVNCLHVSMPIDLYYMGDKPKSKKKEFVSVYICEDTKDILFEEELNEFRYCVSRWFRMPGSQYAISPCTVISQPDARTLQSMTWSIMQAGENAVEPPLIGQSEAVLGPVNLFPGGITWVDKNYDERAGAALRPLELGKAPDLGVALHGSIRDQLATTWFLNKLFLPQDTGPMTAQEVERRWQEFQRATQPIIEPAEPERNGRVLDLTFAISMNLGWFGPDEERPQELDGAAIDWTYDNPIEDARKQGLLQKWEQAMALTQAAAQVDPGLSARFDVSQAYEDAMDAACPVEWVRDKDDPEVQQAAQMMQESAQQQMAVEQAGEVAQVAETAAKAGVA